MAILKSKGDGRSSFALNGTWDITPSDNDAFPQHYVAAIPVPSVVDCARPRYDWQKAKFHWYRKRFRLKAGESERVFLVIGQSQFGTDVWVNGTYAGRYIGCYTSHEYEISRFLNSDGEDNEIVIRVGRREDLPAESAVGHDHEKELYTPGIWGDVTLEVCQNPRITSVQVIPDIHNGSFASNVTIENRERQEVSGRIKAQLHERASQVSASEEVRIPFSVPANESIVVPLEFQVWEPKLWSPESPFLYELTTAVEVNNILIDETGTRCGLREFRIDGRRFFLNGRKIFLKGGNIAFHRFLADQERGLLPWDTEWIKRALIDIPKEHNFNFFRNHLGQLYPAWYDIADEGGMLIQSEWHFWGVTGTEEQIKSEFTRWLKDNWNHPSIIIWDALNETSNEVVQKKVVPEMKKLDPTRPWESVDLVEDHPYIYSLGPVLTSERFGFTRGLPELEESTHPVMLNEFVWCWVNKSGEPTRLMDGITERWLGPSAGGVDLLDHQCFLASELVELFRRIRADAIQPFVYLSNNEGPTGHWFQGPIAELNPKPILRTLKNAFSPVGVSIELWDRHFVGGEHRTLRVFLFNDEPVGTSGELHYGITDESGRWISRRRVTLDVEPSGLKIRECEFVFPDIPGNFFAAADFEWSGKIATSRKIAHVVSVPKRSALLRRARIAVLGDRTENLDFLTSQELDAFPLSWSSLPDADVVLVGEGMVRSDDYQSHLPMIESYLKRRGSLVILEPELGVEGAVETTVAGPLALRLEKRADKDKGGYDSYVFPVNSTHPVFDSLLPEHFRMFNGGFGGEMVSQHDIEILSDHVVLARCGVHLRVCALAEATVAGAKIVISRIQTRGRLVQRDDAGGLYARRIDPVAGQYFLNLLAYAATRAHD